MSQGWDVGAHSWICGLPISGVRSREKWLLHGGVVLKPEHTSEYLEGLLKPRLLGPICRGSESLGLGAPN